MENKRKAAVLLANGCEEAESLFTVDILRRGGIVCDMVAIGDELMVTGSHGITVKADLMMKDADKSSYDLLVLPGGQPGSDHLRDNDDVIGWVREFALDPQKFIAAICAAPQVLAKAGVCSGKRVTSYPADRYRALFTDADYVDAISDMEELVVVDGHIITSRGPGSTMPFAYKLVEILGGDAESLKEAMQYNALKKAVSL